MDGTGGKFVSLVTENFGWNPHYFCQMAVTGQEGNSSGQGF